MKAQQRMMSKLNNKVSHNRDVWDLYWASIYHVYNSVSNASIQTLNEAKTQRKQAMNTHANSSGDRRKTNPNWTNRYLNSNSKVNKITFNKADDEVKVILVDKLVPFIEVIGVMDKKIDTIHELYCVIDIEWSEDVN